DLRRFADAIGRLRREHGSLGAAFLAGTRADDATYADAMGRFVDRLAAAAGPRPSYGLGFLLPRVGSGGAAKRLCLYLRWMIRPEDGVDLGTWHVLAPGLVPAKLVIPLDTHIERIGRYLGLTDRRTSGLATALEITASLRRLSPDDPLAYDVALCHLGISGQCPRQRDATLCAGCPIAEVCRLGPEPEGWPGGGKRPRGGVRSRALAKRARHK
ncbi:DUF2400 domain-containing protein, partial [Myxococcota bacterium]|nr:DUF2400 domain-containing protein [Myxococcota bacterium]